MRLTHISLEQLALFKSTAMHHIVDISQIQLANQTEDLIMNFFNRAFDKFIETREAQADRFVNEYMADRGLDSMMDITTDPRG